MASGSAARQYFINFRLARRAQGPHQNCASARATIGQHGPGQFIKGVTKRINALGGSIGHVALHRYRHMPVIQAIVAGYIRHFRVTQIPGLLAIRPQVQNCLEALGGGTRNIRGGKLRRHGELIVNTSEITQDHHL